MTYVITEPCIRDGACAAVCPVECIVAGPEDDSMWGMAYWIDPDTCIDCGACIPECPFEAIFTEDEIPTAFKAAGGEYINRSGLTGHYEGEDVNGEAVVLDTVRQLETGEVIDLSEDEQTNKKFFEDGPGYG